MRVFAANSFLLMGLGALGAVIGGAIPVGRRSSAASTIERDDAAAYRARVGTAVISAIGAIPLLGIRAVDGAPEGRARAWRFRKSDLRLFGKLLCADALQAFGAGAMIGFLPLFFALRYGLSAGVARHPLHHDRHPRAVSPPSPRRCSRGGSAICAP